MSAAGPPSRPESKESHPSYAPPDPGTFHPTVFLTSAGLILAFVLLTLVFREEAAGWFGTAQAGITHGAGWFFLLAANFFLVVCVTLLFSRAADIRIGGANAVPDFTFLQWLAMLFSAGMGIGLVFWSVAEPVFHLMSPATASVEAESPEAAGRAMAITYFHWGLHAWGIYALMGLALAYFSFNRGLPLTVRSTLAPLLGRHIQGPVGNLVDIVASVAALFGVATSLGFGVQQVAAGLEFVFGWPADIGLQIGLITGITALATASVVMGLDGGIRRISECNMLLALVLLLFVFLAGPTLFVLDGFVQNLGRYVQDFVRLSTWTETYSGTHWRDGWTIFYWAWWISWSPFVGMFIARISRGRTVREFVAGVLLVPTLLTFIWLSVFGNAALFEVGQGDSGLVTAVHEALPTSLFVLLDHYPMAPAPALLAIAVVILFFVTSSDSGSLVIDILTSGGHLDPPVWQRIFWAVMEGVVAGVLLIAGGSQALTALQTASIVTGLPFALVLVAVGWSLLRALRSEAAAMKRTSPSKAATDAGGDKTPGS